jgi:DNA-directed RNA polymerase beta' subunit
MSIYSELSYGERVVSGIRGIQFCVLSEQELRRRSVCEVVEGKTFEGNEPVAGGLFDTRMGVVDGSRVCATCQQRNTFCPGHFGHVVLARPVFYVQFFEVVRKVLKCVCFRCSRLLVDVESPEVRALLARKISRQKRWEAMSKLCQKVKRCGQETLDGCGARVPDKVTKTEDMRLTLSWRDASSASAAAAAAAAATAAAAAGETVAGPAARDVVFNAEDVLRVLRGITDASCEALGFSSEHAKPEWMICTVLPVPPPAVRPSVRHESGQRQEDDLTHKLCDIIKWNNTLRDKIARGHSFDTIESSYVPMLQYHVATLIDNSVPSMYPSKDRAGRTFRSLTERLRHKEGRIRGNLMGKRVDFSARTVITPDPNLSIDELGVPLKIAMNLTFPEIVGPLTRDELQRLVIAGPDKYPGAKQVRKVAAGNRTIRLKGHPDPASIVLEDGDVVERHLRNGDYVLFNRQPSLHKMSMMAHRVRVMPYHTFRLNVCVCASYNADFDGDEMNMHVPQSLQTLYEIKELAAVPMHILSPRYSKPIITIVQDVALGVFRITQPHVRISQRQLFNLACGNQLLGGYASGAAGAEGAGGALMRVAPGVTSSADMWSTGGAAGEWTGRQVLSTVLPPTASVYMKNDIANPKDFNADIDEIIVEGGVIRSGVLSEKVFSRASRGLVHSTYNTLGAAAVTAMLNSTQKLVCDWLVLSGFSVGVSDLIVSPITTEKKHTALSLAKAKVHESMRSVHAGTFENNSTKSNADFLEEQIMDILSKATDAAGKLCREGFGIGNNRMLNMIISGSKGKPMNFTQMTACLGGQAIEQKRVPDGFDGRTLPHFTKYDDGPEARGFVEHSFIEGLSPHEFFFHAMAGRIGLIDTAVRTSETGYLQRRLVKAMEDCKVHHDLTVRNANNFIVQFLYGEDGMDAIKLEFQELPTLDKEPAEMRDEFLLVDGDIELRGHVSDSVLETIATMEKAEPGAWAARMEAHFKALVDDRRGVIVGLHGGLKVHDKPVIYPVNIRRIVETAAGLQEQHAKRAAGGAPLVSDLEPTWILDRIDELCSELRVGAELRSGKPVEGIRWMPVLLRCFLSPKTLVRKHRLSRASFDRVVAEVRRDFYAAIASPGEMTGIVAAQSIGEISTQLSQMSTSRVLAVLRGAGPGGGDKVHNGSIGELIDGIMDVPGAPVIDLGGGSSVLDMGHIDMQIVGVSNNEKTSWRRISQISRHPAKGGMIRIHTRSGKTTCATLSHSFLKRTERGIAPVLGSDLKLGDRVPIARLMPDVPDPVKSVKIGVVDVPLSRDLGWLCGAYTADGCVDKRTHDCVSISKVIPEYQDKLRQIWQDIFGLTMSQTFRKAGDQGNLLHGWDMSKYPGTENRIVASFLLEAFGTGSYDKRVPGWAYAADLPFVKGFLCGYFDGDGNVADGFGKGMIRSASVSEKLTEDVVMLLMRVGIFASKCVEKHEKEAGRNDLHTVQISRKYARRFRDEVGPMVVKSKADALENVIAYVERDKGDVHRDKEYIDMIPELGGIIAGVAKTLAMDGQSRNFGHLERGGKDIGRETLCAYVPKFEALLEQRLTESSDGHRKRVASFAAMRAEIAAARSTPKAVNGAGIMSIATESADALISLRSETMGCAALGAANLFSCRRTGRISASIYERHLDALEAATAAVREAELADLADVRDDKMPVLRSALDADVVWDEIVEIERLPDPGEMVYDFTVPGNDSFMVDCGVLVHNTLNTFHGAGVSSFTKVTSGVPRMKELMSMSKNIKTPGMTIRLRREWATSREKAQAVLSSIETTHFRDLVRRSSVHFDPSDGADTSVEDDAGMMAFYREFASGGTGESANASATASACDAHASPWLLRFEFDRMKMLDLQVTMLDLESTLVDHYDTSVSCVLSDDNAARLVCRMRLSSSALPADSADLLTEVKALEQAIMDQLVVKGVPKIDKAVLSKPMVALSRYDPATDAFIASDEWGIETAGSNLVDVMCHPCVDYTRTVTNDVYEVYTVLGIEAACRMLIDEMRAVLGSETPLDHRHLALLVDTMSNRGFFMSIDRHGINNRGELGPLAKCSFEQTTDMLIKAGMFAERDRINGVSANIMLGQVAPCGTGDCMVLIDGERMAAMGKPVPLPLPKGQQQQRHLGAPQQQGQSDAPANALEVNNIPALEVAPARASKEEDPTESAAAAPRRKKNVAKLDIV